MTPCWLRSSHPTPSGDGGDGEGEGDGGGNGGGECDGYGDGDDGSDLSMCQMLRLDATKLSSLRHAIVPAVSCTLSVYLGIQTLGETFDALCHCVGCAKIWLRLGIQTLRAKTFGYRVLLC